MAVDLIGGVSASQNTNLQVAAVSQQDFLRILVTQLSFQDPLKPIDNQAFIAQIAQFTALEQTRQLNDGINTLLNIQSTTQSIDLIARRSRLPPKAGRGGRVSTLTFVQSQPRLVVTLADGQVLADVTLDKVSVIRA
jgi:flagellar basal-body rod modification protein FlgD